MAGRLSECARADVRPVSGADEPGFEDDVARISTQLQRVRGLRFERRVRTDFVPAADVGLRAVTGYEDRYTDEEARRDERVLATLGIVPEGIDLQALGRRLTSEGTAGFYRPKTKTLVAGTTGGSLSSYDAAVLAHELTHALVDQRWGLPRMSSNDPARDDEMFARRALAEGDATLAMSRYMSIELDEGGLAAYMSRFAGRIPFSDTPYVFQRAAGFPYAEGMAFVCAGWRRGGWRAVDRLYRRPPVSTAEIIWPGRYWRRWEPTPAREPDDPGKRWKRIYSSSFGAADLMFMLELADESRSGDVVPGDRVQEVRGWNGGALRAWADGEDTAIHLSLIDGGVETGGGTDWALCGVVRDWYETTFPDARRTGPVAPPETWRSPASVARLVCDVPRVELAFAPTSAVVRRLTHLSGLR